jgi:hypothetical protein
VVVAEVAKLRREIASEIRIVGGGIAHRGDTMVEEIKKVKLKPPPPWWR